MRGAGAAAAAFFCTTNRGKLLQHKLIRVPCNKKSTRAPVSPVPQYGYSVQKVIFEYSFHYTQEKLFLKHTTRTFRFSFAPFHRCIKLFLRPFNNSPGRRCLKEAADFLIFRSSITDKKQNAPAFRDIKKNNDILNLVL